MDYEVDMTQKNFDRQIKKPRNPMDDFSYDKHIEIKDVKN